MKAIAKLLVAAALIASGAWGADSTPGDSGQLLPSGIELVQPSVAAPDARLHVAANFDGPMPIPALMRPFDAVGRIEDARRTRTGTGFLIGPCSVLTAYHVLFLPGETASKRAKFTFALGHAGYREFALVVQASPVFWGNFSYSEDTATEDFAVLHVPSCPGRDFAPIALAPMSLTEIEQSGGTLRNAGYPVGHSRGRVWGDENCTVGGMHPLEPKLFAVDCFAAPGMSGGPVLAEKDGQLTAVAIMSRAVINGGSDSAGAASTEPTGPDLSKYNEALPVSEFFARLLDLGLVGQ